MQVKTEKCSHLVNILEKFQKNQKIGNDPIVYQSGAGQRKHGQKQHYVAFSEKIKLSVY